MAVGRLQHVVFEFLGWLLVLCSVSEGMHCSGAISLVISPIITPTVTATATNQVAAIMPLHPGVLLAGSSSPACSPCGIGYLVLSRFGC